ncbi:MAG: two-component sensor histidine kinase, partial [Rubrobacter sp.]|nr:two-component sensor histidine kinase [Rubrobacter sp.]
RADPARKSGGGAGLGLSIARQVAEAHDGTIEVESNLGEGSTFMLLLPRKPIFPQS